MTSSPKSEHIKDVPQIIFLDFPVLYLCWFFIWAMIPDSNISSTPWYSQKPPSLSGYSDGQRSCPHFSFWHSGAVPLRSLGCFTFCLLLSHISQFSFLSHPLMQHLHLYKSRIIGALFEKAWGCQSHPTCQMAWQLLQVAPIQQCVWHGRLGAYNLRAEKWTSRLWFFHNYSRCTEHIPITRYHLSF